jgi:hypothetical protein
MDENEETPCDCGLYVGFPADRDNEYDDRRGVRHTRDRCWAEADDA